MRLKFLSHNALVNEIEESIAAGKNNATLIPWVGDTNLFGSADGTSEASILAAREGLEQAGWKWSTAGRCLERNGWQVWFRSQGRCGAPIAQWSKI